MNDSVLCSSLSRGVSSNYNNIVHLILSLSLSPSLHLSCHMNANNFFFVVIISLTLSYSRGINVFRRSFSSWDEKILWRKIFVSNKFQILCTETAKWFSNYKKSSTIIHMKTWKTWKTWTTLRLIFLSTQLPFFCAFYMMKMQWNVYFHFYHFKHLL
jgi:hypothetical protein